MKISKSIRDTYDNQRSIYEALKARVDETIGSLKDPNWHYVSRIKEKESYALKIETGRCKDPKQLEDFFACTIIVENLSSIPRAESLVKKMFDFNARRPKSDYCTSKPSDSFRFDDTRLYVRWKDNPKVRPTGLNGLLFEVQIKTFLAHAWSIATHDITYKTDAKSWPKERIAFQIKAMLEHAETSIQEATQLAESSSLKKTDELSERISAIIQLLNDCWPPELLPSDKKRLAENIDNLIRNLKIDLESLRRIVSIETALGRGARTLNLSPYSSIIDALFNQELQKMANYLTGSIQKFKIFIPKELELPLSLQSAQLKNVIMD